MTTHPAWTQRLLRVGDLGGEPVYRLGLDAADRPWLPPSALHLSRAEFWYLWRGEWRQRARDDIGVYLTLTWTPEEAPYVWAHCTEPPTQE